MGKDVVVEWDQKPVPMIFVIADNRPGMASDMTYTYDTLHGWLTGVSSPCGFSEQLLRETATNAQHSGNIGRMLWRNTANGEQHRYDFTYDSLGRLTNSISMQKKNNMKCIFLDETDCCLQKND